MNERRREMFGLFCVGLLALLGTVGLCLGGPTSVVLAQTTPTVEVNLPFEWDGAQQAMDSFLQNELIMVGLYVVVGLGLAGFALLVFRKAFT